VKSLDEAGPVGCVTQDCPKAGNRISNAVFKVNECIGRPELLSQFLTGEEAARASEQDGQQLERAAVDRQTNSMSAELPGTDIQFEAAKADDLSGVLGRHAHR
jgi:hypothetical protein